MHRALSAVVFIGLALCGSTAVRAQSVGVRIDPDGTIRAPSLTLRPSQFLSAELREAYAKHLTGALAAPTDPLPAMTAPRAEWERFFMASDAALATPLAQQRQRYAVEITETQIGGVRAAVITPKDGIAPENRRRVLINLHGGIYRGLLLGQLESIPLAAIGRIKVIALDFRHEPFDAYPAPSEDLEKVYRVLLRDHQPLSIGIFGVSFGGLLASQGLAWLQARGLPRPGAAGIFWCGLAAAPFPFGGNGDSKLWQGDGIPHEDTSAFDALLAKGGTYLQDVSATDFTAYPGSSDTALKKFPPTLFLTGTRSHDLSPSVVAHARLLKLGVESSLYVMEGGWHGASLTPGVPEAHDANAYVARWFSQQLAP
jgi:epsilon-lactone hydrolase